MFIAIEGSSNLYNFKAISKELKELLGDQFKVVYPESYPKYKELQDNLLLNLRAEGGLQRIGVLNKEFAKLAAKSYDIFKEKDKHLVIVRYYRCSDIRGTLCQEKYFKYVLKYKFPDFPAPDVKIVLYQPDLIAETQFKEDSHKVDRSLRSIELGGGAGAEVKGMARANLDDIKDYDNQLYYELSKNIGCIDKEDMVNYSKNKIKLIKYKPEDKPEKISKAIKKLVTG